MTGNTTLGFPEEPSYGALERYCADLSTRLPL